MHGAMLQKLSTASISKVEVGGVVNVDANVLANNQDAVCANVSRV